MDVKASVATWKLSAGLIQQDRQFDVICPEKLIILKVEEFEFLWSAMESTLEPWKWVMIAAN